MKLTIAAIILNPFPIPDPLAGADTKRVKRSIEHSNSHEAGALVNNSAEKTLRQPMDLNRAQVPLGQVHVIAERCKECGLCINYCPTDVLVYTEDINSRGYRFPMVAEGKESACVHCQFCNMICPELAIFTIDVSDEQAEGKSNAG